MIILLLLLITNYACVNIQTSEIDVLEPDLLNKSQTDTLKFTSGIRAIFQDSKANYWLGSHNEGLARYDGNEFEYFTTEDALYDNQIRSIAEDENGTIWIGTARGVNSFDGEAFTRYPAQQNAPIRDWSSSEGNLWFYAGEEGGVYRFDGMNLNYLAFPKTETSDPNKSFGVTGMSKDKEGRLWLASYSALFCFDGQAIDFYGPEELLLEGGDLIHIRSVLADSKGRIWIGNNGIGVLLKEGNSVVNFYRDQGKLLPVDIFQENIKSNQYYKNSGLQSVFAIEEDGEGNIWFGDRDSGAWRYDGKVLTNFTIDEPLSNAMIWDIYRDKSGNLLFGLANGDVYAFNGDSFEKRF